MTPAQDAARLLTRLRSLARPERRKHMAAFGIATDKALGVQVGEMRPLALEEIRERGRDTRLALELWETGLHEPRILATMLADPGNFAEADIERWVAVCDSWDLTDQCCANLFGRTPMAWDKADQWTLRPEEFVKRAGFVLMARLALTEKKTPDERFFPFFALCEARSEDGRVYVKKAVSWALRQMGKRSPALHERAVPVARTLASSSHPGKRWAGRDALRELTGEKVLRRLQRMR